MICVSGGERTCRDLERRLEDHRHLPLQEVRLDLLERVDDEALALLSSGPRAAPRRSGMRQPSSPGIVATCRSREQGGGFTGSEAERLALLERALEHQPGYLDLEASAPAEVRRRLYQRRGPTRLILSWHLFEGGPEAAVTALREAPPEADLLKLACAVEDVADLAPLLRLGQREQRPLLCIGMGLAGTISRVLYGRFGSPWTYVVPDGAEPLAPGQLSLGGALSLRVDRQAELAPIGLLGGLNVTGSPGPRVYNHLFRQHGLPFLYLPVVTLRPREALPLLEQLGFVGCSVTMPVKESVAALIPPDRLQPPADALGAVNTIVWDQRGSQRTWTGMNTDVDALHTLLGERLGRPALVLGAGGAALAAAFVLQRGGSTVTVSSRTLERARTLARRVPGCQVLPWERRGEHPFDVLVNATPVGVDGTSDPMPPNVTWQDRLVLDAVLARRSTPLVQRVREAGGRAIEGREWWLHQGGRQMEALVGRAFTLAEMQEALHVSA
jgi:3-dehydroquinate dehydratase/shikimate dehydrogenase